MNADEPFLKFETVEDSQIKLDIRQLEGENLCSSTESLKPSLELVEFNGNIAPDAHQHKGIGGSTLGLYNYSYSSDAGLAANLFNIIADDQFTDSLIQDDQIQFTDPSHVQDDQTQFTDTPRIQADQIQITYSSPIQEYQSAPPMISVVYKEPLYTVTKTPTKENDRFLKNRKYNAVIKEESSSNHQKKNKKSQTLPTPLVYLGSQEPLSFTMIKHPKFLVQSGCGMFTFEVRGNANPNDIIIIARCTQPHFFTLNSFTANVPSTGEVKMNIKFTRTNSDCNHVQLVFHLIKADPHMVTLFKIETPMMDFCTNTKDLPNPTIMYCETELVPMNADLVRHTVKCNRLKWGKSVKLTFFVVDSNNTVIYVVNQDDILGQEATKTSAFFDLPSHCVKRDYKLFAQYVGQNKSGKNAIPPVQIGDIWQTPLQEGYITI
ncbi:hypothetical protein PPL_03054 [Heterostelium album PN500]|uniref:Uncharacterized protein n=1 Tax=Heterostelium pallidum (strain ATCC 26659 / Pp 5 / PN500) TaxID=670386 RepID=D3B3T3_HETP5|nr:hypothetical protein PPL_03054 [Heterostelium album PN500]EFA83981.1 hypothetical protein PPL_03054 [Heterostelium album PN500]|eukprot:XP_020436098.1 hypothetical protein PPL_03054 [Heterostelium album PN500]